jgi:hypothetical protein
MIGAARDGDRLQVSTDSVWLLEAWGRFRALGFTDALGFKVDELQMYEDAVNEVFQKETALVLDRLAHLPADEIAAMLERALPLVHAALIHFHTAAVRNLFAAMRLPKEPTC